MLNLEPCHDPHYHLREVTQDATAYYLREGEAPGVWRGSGATALGLAGEVTPQALHDVFHGKNPADGTYLLSARGSASRASARAAEATMDVGAVAVRLGMSEGAVRARLRSGALDGEKGPDGAWRVTAVAVDAYRAAGSPPPGRRPDDSIRSLTLAQAASRVGVSRAYLSRLVAEERPTVTEREDGSGVQYLVGTRDERGRWRIALQEVERFIEQRRVPRAVPAYDLALRAPKSVSILHALGHLVPQEDLVRLGLPINVAGQVVEAHHAAVEDAIGFLERHAAWVRKPRGRVQAAGLAVALFDHRSSRAGDPLLHTHAVIANVATGIDGRRAALDGTALYAWARAGGHVYQARLRAELVSRLGVRFEAPHNGLADIAGVPRELIEHFSERRREILDVMHRLGVGGADAAHRAAIATRRPKEHGHQSPDELAQRAAALGFGPTELLALIGHGLRRTPDAVTLDAVRDHLASPEGLTARTTRVDLRDAVCGFATELADGATAAQLEGWATGLLHDPQRFVPVLGVSTRAADVIRRTDGRIVRAGGVERTYATPELLAHEAALVAVHAEGQGIDREGVGAGLARPDAVEAAIDARPSLRADQVEMVRRITSSGHGVEVVVGGPGSGKTYALGAAAEAWRRSGLRVVGASLQGGAADVLASEADLDERYTLTGLLLRCRREGTGYLAGSLVIVDEAGMADTRQLSRLMQHARRDGAKVVLVGDPDQIPEVGAGGAFRFLVERVGPDVVALRENHRQVHPSDRHRLGLIRAGAAEEAIVSAQTDGRWHTAPSADAVRQAMLAAWAVDPGEPGREKFMVATSVAEVEWLNRGARAILRATGALGDEAITVRLDAPNRAVDRREFRVGDRVRAARNDWSQSVFNGMVGTVTSVDPRSFSVGVVFDRDRDAGQPRELGFGRPYLQEGTWRTSAGRTEVVAPGLTHAYATTANGVQGRTTVRAYVLMAEAGLYRQAAFTAASRARADTHYYAVTVPDADEAERHHRPEGVPVSDPADTTALAQAMARDGAQTMASLTDPRAAEVGELMGRPPAWLWTERQRLAERLGEGPPLAEALRRLRTAIGQTYDTPLRQLEACAPLTSALTACLRVPGSSPDRIASLILGRGDTKVRELGSARDPTAVLVWAARRHAHGVLVAEARAQARGLTPTDLAARNVAGRRLRLLDEAIERQRVGRLHMMDADPTAWLVDLVGPRPGATQAIAHWRRAADAVLAYRDTSGLYDRTVGGADVWERALGPSPSGPDARSHYEQVREIVVEVRAAILVAGLARHVPAMGVRPARGVEALAQRTLASLTSELASMQLQRDDRDAAAAALARARRDLASLEAVAGRGLLGREEQRGDGAARVAAARERVARLTELLSAEPPNEARIDLLTEAVSTRELRLRARLLTDPPHWLLSDVCERATALVPSDDVVGRLATAYGHAAVHADEAARIDDVVLPDEVLAAAWREADRAALSGLIRQSLGIESNVEPALDVGP